MDNSQFRSLLDSQSFKASPTNSKAAPGSPKNGPATSLLGSRARSSIPMTPRSVGSQKLSRSSRTDDFARQVAEHKRTTLGQPALKKTKSNVVPKGSRLAAGYQDRATLLREQNATGQADEKAGRIRALEEMVKLQQIDQATFDKLREEIGVGGDVASTHLVKGLDRKLLERARKGEDVMALREADGDKSSKDMDHKAKEERMGDQSNELSPSSVEHELESLLEKEVQAKQREARVKKGKYAAPSSLKTAPDEKLSRDEILKQLKASRTAAATEAETIKPTEPTLNSKFRKINAEQPLNKKKSVETVNGRRREVLVVTNPDGTSKRKIRWIDPEDSTQDPYTPPTTGKVLGMEVPAEMAAKQREMIAKQKLEDEADDDIFAGVGADYDPLGAGADDSEDESDEGQPETGGEAISTESKAGALSSEANGQPHNYFSNKSTNGDVSGNLESSNKPAADPAILAALKRAAALRKAQENAEAGKDDGNKVHGNSHSEDFLQRLKKREREDAADIELGFGESRFGDEDDDQEVAVWQDREDGAGKKGSRKRGRKKRKGDKDDVKDVMAVLDKRKR